jgi:AraC-like DNA-binding protein
MNPNPKKFLSEVSDMRQMLDALERIPGAMFMIKNLESRYVYMSKGLRKTIHLPEDFEVVGKTDFDLFPTLIAETYRQNDLQIFRRGKPLINEVHVLGFFTHAMKWAYSSKFPLRNRKGKVIGLITINEEYNDVMGKDAELNRLLPAIEHVSRKYAGRIAIAELGRLCGFSESHFMRVFKQRMKVTPHGFVEQVRLFHAMEALRRSAESVAEVALNCGFYDPSSFVKRFKKFTGTTPLKYRREQQARLKDERGPMALPVRMGI